MRGPLKQLAGRPPFAIEVLLGLLGSWACQASAPPPPPLRPFSGKVRGVALAHIEDPEAASTRGQRGLGTAKSDEALGVLQAHNVEWISVSAYGFVDNQCDTSIQPETDARSGGNVFALQAQIQQAKRRGMKVLLSPSLYVLTEDGWRGRIGFREDGRRCWGSAEWQAFFRSYERFVLHWARVAAKAPNTVALFSIGLELASTTASQPVRLSALIEKVRSVYPGPLTYSANWDEVDRVRFWSDLDVVGINAFYPLTKRTGASEAELQAGANALAERLARLSRRLGRKILFTEVGYKSQQDAALRPWEWTQVTRDAAVDEDYQAAAYRSVFDAFWARRFFAGLFWWKTFTDMDDLTQTQFEPQEPPSGFSPIGKAAGSVLRARFASPPD